MGVIPVMGWGLIVGVSDCVIVIIRLNAQKELRSVTTHTGTDLGRAAPASGAR